MVSDLNSGLNPGGVRVVSLENGNLRNRPLQMHPNMDRIVKWEVECAHQKTTIDWMVAEIW